MADKTEKLPPKGFVIATMREGMLFSPYEIQAGSILVGGCDRGDILDADECHFFDAEKEYRRIRRRARGDVIETVLTAEEERAMEPDLLFIEQHLVKPEYVCREGVPRKLTIVNRYRYSEHDTLVLENYRISY